MADRRDAVVDGYADETLYEDLGQAGAAGRIPVHRAFAVTAREPFEAWRRRRAAG